MRPVPASPTHRDHDRDQHAAAVDLDDALSGPVPGALLSALFAAPLAKEPAEPEIRVRRLAS
ncbi:hypothetical protein SK069_11090 [Patulibacter brassicae]|uniref:FXSXX-COOH protein n=1 Tax=Patulibacter brassicae TaxID=1705717 RepID=A0ABU4VJW1_9ACTN|nr:hypothetical protein [Patulibacter brassicae]MDX8152141.1 hypothetical protein [Patulibacter brassicae]